MDALRVDHCGYNGYHRDTTPTIDEMAKNGVSFDRAIAPGTNTPSSMSAILTGDYAGQDVTFAPAEEWRAEFLQRRPIAGRLSKRGYTTGAVHPQVHASRHFGFDTGFDHFEDFLPAKGEKTPYTWILNQMFDGNGRFATLRNVRSLIRREEALKPWEEYIDEMLDWIRSSQEPFFFWTLLPDTHFPYLPPVEYREYSSRLDIYRANYDCYSRIGETGIEIPDTSKKRIVNVYDDAIRYADAFVRRLWEELEEFDPVFIIHADHGEAFGEHGFYGHLSYPYREVVDVPLVVYNANITGQIDRPVPLTAVPDIVETIADDGTFKPQALGQDWAYTNVIRDGDPVTAVSTPEWKYIADNEGTELYDLESDPGEQEDVGEENAPIADSMENLVRSQRQSITERAAIRQAATECDGLGGER